MFVWEDCSDDSHPFMTLLTASFRNKLLLAIYNGQQMLNMDSVTITDRFHVLNVKPILEQRLVYPFITP